MNKQQLIYSNIIAWGLFILLVAVRVSSSWVEPTQSPPAGNIMPRGAMVAGEPGYIQYNSSGNLAATSNLFWDTENARLGVGTNSPDATLTVAGTVQITGGNPAIGKVFTCSDSDGLGTWAEPPAVPAGVPSGMIAIFRNNCPAGWTPVTELVGRFPFGAAAGSTGTTGGSQTHMHTLQTRTPNVGYYASYVQAYPYQTNTVNHMPPYLTVIYCEKT